MQAGTLVALDFRGTIVKIPWSVLSQIPYFANLDTDALASPPYVPRSPYAFDYVLNFVSDPLNYKVPEQYESELKFYVIEYSSCNLYREKSEIIEEMCANAVDLNMRLRELLAEVTNTQKMLISMGVSIQDQHKYKPQHARYLCCNCMKEEVSYGETAVYCRKCMALPTRKCRDKDCTINAVAGSNYCNVHIGGYMRCGTLNCPNIVVIGANHCYRHLAG